MRRILLWLASTVAAIVLLFTYATSTSSQMVGATSSTAISGTLATAATSGSGTTSSPGGGPSSSSGAPSTAAAKVVTGHVVSTRYGPIQVQLSVAAHTITSVSVLRYPDSDGRDLEINQRALPILVQETLDAQGSGIDMVSGATYSSAGYQDSLQSALDQASL